MLIQFLKQQLVNRKVFQPGQVVDVGEDQETQKRVKLFLQRGIAQEVEEVKDDFPDPFQDPEPDNPPMETATLPPAPERAVGRPARGRK